MTKDSYLLYSLSLAVSFVVLEFATAFIKNLSTNYRMGKGGGLMVRLIEICKVLYTLVTIILCEYIYVNRSAGVSSFLLGCLIFCAIHVLFESKIGAFLFTTLRRPVSRFCGIFASKTRKRGKM